MGDDGLGAIDLRPSKQEMSAELDRIGRQAFAPMRTYDEALDLLPRLRSAFVLTTGCFDLLHLNHLLFLEDARLEARRRAGILVVGVNTDESVRRCKPGRPFQTTDERARLVAGLRAVDFVFTFDQSDPGPLIHALRPAVFTKGREYEGLTGLPEAIACAEVGAELLFLGPPKTRSSTSLIERVRAGWKIDSDA